MPLILSDKQIRLLKILERRGTITLSTARKVYKYNSSLYRSLGRLIYLGFVEYQGNKIKITKAGRQFLQYM